MAQTLTLTQLQAAQKLIANGDLNGFYQYMSSMGYNYAGLADGVITDAYPSGTTANDYLINYAESKGVTVTPAFLLKIETQLATAYITVLEAAAKASPSHTVNADITFKQALNFHTQVFQNNGLNAAAWTLDVPYQVLGQSAMDAYWMEYTDRWIYFFSERITHSADDPGRDQRKRSSKTMVFGKHCKWGRGRQYFGSDEHGLAVHVVHC
jgi:hypothetical protein